MGSERYVLRDLLVQCKCGIAEACIFQDYGMTYSLARGAEKGYLVLS